MEENQIPQSYSNRERKHVAEKSHYPFKKKQVDRDSVILEQFVSLGKMFLELVGEDLEDAVNSVHLEFVAEVKQVPVEEVAEGGEGLVFGHVQDEDSADEAHTLDVTHVAFDHSGSLEDFSEFVLKIGVLTNRINPDMSPGYILINQLQLLT